MKKEKAVRKLMDEIGKLALGIFSLKETAHRRKLSCSYMLVIKLLIHKKAITL